MPAQAEAPSLPPPDTPAVQKILFDKSLWQCYVKPAAINVNIINCIFLFFYLFLIHFSRYQFASIRKYFLSYKFNCENTVCPQKHNEIFRFIFAFCVCFVS